MNILENYFLKFGYCFFYLYAIAMSITAVIVDGGSFWQLLFKCN
ncbi:MAG: hypothetical protein WBG70_08285 [Spirulinaceae cyanobacterium]